jgi:hypothetical protein
MRFSRTIWLPLLTAILGGLVGAFATTRFWLRDWAKTAELHNRVSALQHVRALRQARGGRTDEFVSEMEALLDGEIIGLGASANDPRLNNPESREALKKIARYRKEFPRTSGVPELSHAVDQTLSLVAP